MKGLLLPAAAGAVVALMALAILAALQAGPQTRAEQAAQLATELRCPDCAGLSVAESTSVSASAIRADIADQLAGGATPDQVRSHFVDRYGQWILLSPTSPLAWLLPVIALLAGAAGLLLLVARRRPPPRVPSPVAAGDLRRVRDEVEALDA